MQRTFSPKIYENCHFIHQIRNDLYNCFHCAVVGHPTHQCTTLTLRGISFANATVVSRQINSANLTGFHWHCSRRGTLAGFRLQGNDGQCNINIDARVSSSNPERANLGARRRLIRSPPVPPFANHHVQLYFNATGKWSEARQKYE